MIFGTLKSYAIALLAGLAGVLAVVVKLLGSRSKRLEIERDYLKAKANRDRVIAEKDNEFEAQARSRRADIARDLDDGSLDTLSDPASQWQDTADSCPPLPTTP
jgi:hypothetical protein